METAATGASSCLPTEALLLLLLLLLLLRLLLQRLVEQSCLGEAQANVYLNTKIFVVARGIIGIKTNSVTSLLLYVSCCFLVHAHGEGPSTKGAPNTSCCFSLQTLWSLLPATVFSASPSSLLLGLAVTLEVCMHKGAPFSVLLLLLTGAVAAPAANTSLSCCSKASLLLQQGRRGLSCCANTSSSSSLAAAPAATPSASLAAPAAAAAKATAAAATAAAGTLMRITQRGRNARRRKGVIKETVSPARDTTETGCLDSPSGVVYS